MGPGGWGSGQVRKQCECINSGVPILGLQHLSHATSDESLQLPETLLLLA